MRPVFLFPFGHRHLLLGHPVPLGNSASFTVGLPERVMRPGPQPGFTRSARVRRGRGGCPLCPGAAVSLPAGQHPQPGTCAFQRLALNPAKASTCEARNHETSAKGSIVHPSGLPLARGPRVAREPFGFPPSSAPCRYRQRTSGRRQVIRTQTRGLHHRHNRTSFVQPTQLVRPRVAVLPFGYRHSLPGHPVPPGACAPLTIGLPHHPQAARTRAGFPCSARVRHGWGRAPSIPRGLRCLPRPGTLPARRMPPFNGRSLPPRCCSSVPEGPTNGASARVHWRSPLPAFPSPVIPGTVRGPSGFSLSSAPG